jgi:hypothetical protein
LQAPPDRPWPSSSRFAPNTFSFPLLDRSGFRTRKIRRLLLFPLSLLRKPTPTLSLFRNGRRCQQWGLRPAVDSDYPSPSAPLPSSPHSIKSRSSRSLLPCRAAQASSLLRSRNAATPERFTVDRTARASRRTFAAVPRFAGAPSQLSSRAVPLPLCSRPLPRRAPCAPELARDRRGRR